MSFNADLAHEALAHIRLNPETHVQSDWRCETGMCMAGWVSALSGARWFSENPNSHQATAVVVEPDQVASGFENDVYWLDGDSRTVAHGLKNPQGRQFLNYNQPVDTTNLTPVMHCSDYARMLLGLTADETGALFQGDNTIDVLEAVVKTAENNDDKPIEHRARAVGKAYRQAKGFLIEKETE